MTALCTANPAAVGPAAGGPALAGTAAVVSLTARRPDCPSTA
ncbi:hypothetical protein PXO_05497 [Xanthomonas oryzae pv. oryzae PXO99A]|uniref:Uncharacterized protein n=1 Tax=Xanthomonas oryzae pv. oryzae (strain PXO99A) TaxID=360094 RepID=A0A0K0GHR7_XANOP|nr:hypothetical protein PXO_05497 [Xanthomonas oryzae pv. oryzae PXO99A]